MIKRLYTIPEVAEAMAIFKPTAYRFREERCLTALIIKVCLRAPVQAVEVYISRQAIRFYEKNGICVPERDKNRMEWVISPSSKCAEYR